MKTLRHSLVASLIAVALGSCLTAMAQSPGTVTAAPTPTNTAKTKSGTDLAGDLAKADLAKQGITNPTPSQLSAARASVTDQRAKGIGWGQIAQSRGLNLGQVVSAANRERRDARKAQAKSKSVNDKHGKTGHTSRSTHSGANHKSGGAKGSEHGGSHDGGGGGHGGGGHGK